MPSIDIVKIRVNGMEYSGWQSVVINDGLQEAAASFELSVTDFYKYRLTHRDKQLIKERWLLRAGDKCEVFIDDELLLTGYIDVHDAEISDASHSISLSGRSMAADLVDCSAVHTPSNFKSQSIVQIAEALTKPFGVPVILDTGITPTLIDQFEFTQGETVFEVIERLARKNQLLVTSTPSGALLLTRSSTNTYPFKLQNYKRLKVTMDNSKNYSEYIGKSQQRGESKDDPLEAARVSGTVADSSVKRYRPLIVRPEGSNSAEDTKKRVEWQASRNKGDSIKASCTLTGFRDPQGSVWRKNRRIWVEDEPLDIDNELLIDSVRFSKNDQGTLTELTLVHPNTYLPDPESTPATKKTKTKLASKKANYFDEKYGSTT